MLRPDDLKAVYFVKSEPLIETIETGLIDLREGAGSEATIDSLCRAAHSIQASAGVFGFARLSAFAQPIAMMLDAIQRGCLTVTPHIVDALLSATAVLIDLIQSARAEIDLPANYEDECRAMLEQFWKPASGVAA